MNTQEMLKLEVEREQQRVLSKARVSYGNMNVKVLSLLFGQTSSQIRHYSERYAFPFPRPSDKMGALTDPCCQQVSPGHQR